MKASYPISYYATLRENTVSRLNKVRVGDENAAQEIVNQLTPLVRRIARAHGHRRTQPEDLCQEVFMKVFAKLHQYAGEVPFEHWVSRIAVNTCRDRTRGLAARLELRWSDLSEDERESLDGLICDHDSHEVNEQIVARDLVGLLLSNLSSDDQLVLTLLELEQKSITEVSRITGWTANNLRVRAFRARDRMRRVFRRLHSRATETTTRFAA